MALKTTQLTGGFFPGGAVRIDAACWLDGNDDELIVEFWSLPGSIFRSQYDRRTTQSKVEFLDVRSEAYARMRAFADGQIFTYSI
jgi:hypothetical protein